MAQRKLVLFDVDGTLISPGPIPRQAMAEAISTGLGRAVTLSFLDVAGQTDPTIIRNALAQSGTNDKPDAEAVAEILEHYLTLLETRLPGSEGVEVFPGAAPLVRACVEQGWVPALLTGNVERGARAKLADTGLWDLFAFGVFGSDGNTREDLPWIARERAWDTLHESFRPQDTIIIGDTPNDAAIAGLNRNASLIVCRREDEGWRAAIAAENPTWLVDDFADVPGLIELMKGAG